MRVFGNKELIRPFPIQKGDIKNMLQLFTYSVTELKLIERKASFPEFNEMQTTVKFLKDCKTHYYRVNILFFLNYFKIIQFFSAVKQRKKVNLAGGIPLSKGSDQRIMICVLENLLIVQ